MAAERPWSRATLLVAFAILTGIIGGAAAMWVMTTAPTSGAFRLGGVIGGLVGIGSISFVVPLLLPTRLKLSLPLVFAVTLGACIGLGRIACLAIPAVAFIEWLTCLLAVRLFTPPIDQQLCPNCGYDMRGLVGRICPECGHDWAPPPPA